jgi:hypothetical protein
LRNVSNIRQWNLLQVQLKNTNRVSFLDLFFFMALK